jgi:hypothetical protein
MEVGMEGVYAKRKGSGGRIGRAFAKLTNRVGGQVNTSPPPLSSGYADFILDYENETLGAYMD